MRLTRRKFLKIFCAGTGAAALGVNILPEPQDSIPELSTPWDTSPANPYGDILDAWASMRGIVRRPSIYGVCKEETDEQLRQRLLATIKHQ